MSFSDLAHVSLCKLGISIVKLLNFYTFVSVCITNKNVMFELVGNSKTNWSTIYTVIWRASEKRGFLLLVWNCKIVPKIQSKPIIESIDLCHNHGQLDFFYLF